MKKYLLITFIMITSLVYGNIIEKTYYFSNPQITKIGDFHTINFSNCSEKGEVGQPTLPFHPVKIALNPNEIAYKIEIEGNNLIDIDDKIVLYPRQFSRPLSDKSKFEFQIDSEFYSSNNNYPISRSSKITTEFMHGNAIALSSITPVQYNASEKKVSYFSSLKVKIYTKPNTQMRNITQIQKSDLVKAYVDNPENVSFDNNLRNDKIDILVITPEIFIDDFADYENQYLQKGYKVELAPVETIYAEMTGIDNQEKIRNFIIEKYNNNQVEYVLLGGDIEHIPARGFYCTVQSSTIQEDNNIPADIYYSALDGNWNTDEDDLWGEIGEDDLLPEVSVGRLPFSNSDELANMLNKDFSYQNNPVIEDLDKPLLAGEHLYDDPETWGADYLDLLIGEHDDNGYTTSGIPEESDYYTLYERDVANWSAPDLVEALEQGTSFLHHVGHANATYVAHMTNSFITNENFSQINGTDNNYMLMYTHGCICGSFDTDDCIAEEMLKIDNLAAGFIGNSRYGWFNEGQTEGPSGHLHREFVNAIYEENNSQIGYAHLISKYESAPFVTADDQWEEGAIRWVFYDCNVLADPAMKVWTNQLSQPEIISEGVIPIGSESYFVNVQNQENVNLKNIHCALVFNNEVIGSAVTNDSGIADILFDAPIENAGIATLVVDGYNLITSSTEIFITEDNQPLLSISSFAPVTQFSPSEIVNFNLEIENVTSINADNLTIEISSSNENIEIINNSIEVTQIAGQSIETITDCFEIEIADTIADQENIDINVTIVTGELTFTQDFVFNSVAPVLVISSVSINDSEGNNNGTIDADENFSLEIGIENIGHFVSSSISSNCEFVSPFVNLISEPIQTFENLYPETTNNISYDFTANDDVVDGELVTFQFELQWDFYSDVIAVHTTTGASVESFESGYNSYSWSFLNGIVWPISFIPYDGNLSSSSPDISDNETAAIMITTNTVGDQPISFYRKVSTEAEYDFLTFYIDDAAQESWSGELEWELAEFIVPAGEHILKWEYAKDGGVSNGDDKVWLDLITLPAMLEITENQQETDLPEVSKIDAIYPNPFNPKSTISFSTSATENVNIEIYNIKGQLIKTVTNRKYDAGQHKVNWYGKDNQNKQVSSGMYFARLKTDSEISIHKMMLLK